MNVRHIYHIIGAMLCTTALWLLSSCESDGPEASETSTELSAHELQVTMGSRPFSNYDSAARTRALPTGFAALTSSIDQIQAYMTYQESGTSGAQAYTSTVFNYKQDGDIWTTRVPLKDVPHYVYGFMPKSNLTDIVTVTPLDNDFAKGAIMTLRGLNVVVSDDICIIVSAEGYGSVSKPVLPDMSNHLGNFTFDPSKDGDKLFLLVDHLYAGLRFNMKIGDNYSKLRTIQVKNIKLIPDNGDNDVVETINAVVKIVANTSGINPIVRQNDATGVNISGEVTFSENTKGKDPKPAVLYDGPGKALTTTSQQFMACFCATTSSQFILETKYDVYDTKNNLIREGETARNKIRLLHTLASGQVHTVNITVEPTYLYMLSEPDLDNPTFEVN